MASDPKKLAARRRVKSSAKTGIATMSAIAIALGSSAVIPGVYSERHKYEAVDIQQVAESENTGGIRGADGKGAIEPADQLASDIGSGSCTVNFSGQQGSKGGFSFLISEPSKDTPNRREFGVNVKMDGSKDRTWRDFLILGNNNGAPVRTHTVAASAPGDSLTGEDITHSTSSVMSIGRQGPRGPLTATIAADLSADDIAEAATETGVSYGWKDSYTEDNTDSTKHIFRTPNAEVSFNPWPSENDNCSAISVDWVPKEKLVIRPGEELKVGHINADANSMPRMVAEAYDAQGKYIGSSNTTASGGEQKLRIDDNGDIFYTVPKYKGTKLSAQQGTRFSVMAQPRTVKQLRDAIPSDAFGQVFEESNGPERYSKPNVISGHQWSLDDTQFHDPEYSPAQQAILSGVDSENGPIATGPQSVTFKQSGDKIADLVKSRDEGGVEAEVKLDTRYVYTGWKATMDPNTYEVTVTAPPNPAPGTFAQPRVIVTYSNGSQDIIPLLTVVDPNDTQVTNLTGPGLVQGVPGKPMTGTIDVAPAMDGHDASTPTSFEVDPDTVPEGWTVEVKNDGTITVTATSPENAANNSKITPKITARYPDGTTDEVEAVFQVTNNVKVPDYTAVTGKAKEEVKLQPAMPNIGLGGNADDEEPNRYTFPDGSLEYKTGDWTVTIDENTGELTSTIPDSALPGAQITVPVKAYYPSGANPQVTTGAINVIGDGTGEDEASYRPQVTKSGVPVTSDISTQLSDPKLGTYKLPSKLPPNWTFSIDENGTVTATPDESVPNGSSVSVPVEVTYPDGSKATVLADFSVVDEYSSANSPSYPTVTGKPGTSVTSTVNRTHLSDAAEPKFSIITDPNDPSYIAPPRNLKWEDVKIDPDTGDIITPIAPNALPGSSADIPVRVTYKDGSSNNTIATVVVVANQNQVYEPRYRQQTTIPGQPVDSPIPDESKVPERDLIQDPSKRYSVPETLNGWTLSVDENGNVTATPPEDAKPGDGVDAPVTVTYIDGSTDTVYAPFKVKSQQKDINEPVYPVESTKPGTQVTRNVNLNNAPSDSTFSFGVGEDGNPIKKTTVDGWDYEIDPRTGEVSVTPPSTAKPGDKQITNVTVTYPDGSTDLVPVGTVVNLTKNYEAEPTYPPETVFPGETATAPLDLKLPDGIKVAEDDPKTGTKPYRIEPTDDMKPTGQDNEFGNPTYYYTTDHGNWIVGLDANGNVVATAPDQAEPGDSIDVPVTVTYDDGSQDKVTAPITVKDVPTRKVPFDVEYVYDPAIPAGTYEVVTEGKAGEEKQKGDGTWVQTSAPTNEVVKVGTKPAEAAKDVTWTAPTPYSTVTRPNPDLAPGETKVVQKGVNGERKYTAKFTATGDQASVAESEETKAPVEEIIEYGPKAEDTSVVTKTEKPVPFETKVTFDDTLEAGQQVVDKQGELGTDVETSTQKIVDGKPQGDPEVSTERTKEPVAAEIRVGTKTTGENTESFKAEAPYKVVVKYDPTMPAGESKVTTQGVPGEKTVTIKRNITNSTPDGEPTVTEEITKEPVDEVITVGTKQATASDTVEWTEPIPFSTTVRPNPDLAPGETKVVQEGKNGEASYTASFTGTDGKAEVTESKDRTEPVERIVEYGPRAEDTSVVTKTEKPVPFETEIVFDDSLKAGEQVVDKQGVNGTEVETSTQKIVDGKPSGEPTVTTERTQEPTNAVIRVGTKTEGTNTTESEVEVPFETEIQFDDSLPAGTQETVQEGQPGKDKVTTTQTIENSKVTGTTTETERVKEPVKKIIKVGTKGATTSKTVEWTENTPFEVEVRENPNLKAGETKVVQEGKPGEVKHTVTVITNNGEISTDDSTETVSEPTKQIIEVGTAPSQTELTDKHTEQLPFETLIEVDPNLEAGKVVEDQPGAFGSKDVTKVWQLKDGQVVGDPEVSENVTKEPTPRKLRVGAKQATETSEVPVQQDRGFYGAELTKPGQSASQSIQDGAEGNTYEIGALPAGWTATVDENGTVTATPPADAKSGDYAEIPVTVTPKGGKPYVANAVFIVKEDQAVDPTDPTDPTDPEIVTAPTYNPDVITAGDTKTVTINTGHVEGNSYELGEVPAGWTVTIDETTGELTVTPPADTPSGTIKEIPVKVTTKDGEVFDVKTVIGVVSDNCGCDPVEPTDPTDKPDPSDNPDPSENPAPTDKPDPTDKPEPTDKPDPTDKPEPTDKPDKQSSEGSSVWPVLVPLILVPAIIGRIFGHNQGSSFPDLSPKDPSKPETPAKPTDKPKTEPKDEQPKDEAKATESPEAPRTEDVESTDVTSTVQETTAPTTGAAQNTAAQSTAETSSTSAPSSSSSSSSRHLANTGASVLGIIAAGLALIAGAVLILRPGRRKES